MIGIYVRLNKPFTQGLVTLPAGTVGQITKQNTFPEETYYYQEFEVEFTFPGTHLSAFVNMDAITLDKTASLHKTLIDLLGAINDF